MELLKSLGHPEELAALVNFKLGKCATIRPKFSLRDMTPTMRRCYEYLNKTSRSFSAVIQALDGELRHVVCIFYLVLRALDTVEDDMTIPVDRKIPMLKEFYTYLYDADWKFLKSQEKDKVVLEDFITISHEFRGLSTLYQEVIADITKKMGHGMTVFLERELDTEQEWDEVHVFLSQLSGLYRLIELGYNLDDPSRCFREMAYCHYMAGLVGIGLSKLFSASGLEDPVVGQDTELANSMGLFLQKTHVIRDYFEDISQERVFWPKSVWGKYARKLTDFKSPENTLQAVACLNDLITNALGHIPDIIKYLSRLRNQSVYNLCAIPQVIDIATLERLYSNANVFRGVVKIRKGKAVRMMGEATDIEKTKAVMRHFLLKIEERISEQDPSSRRTKLAVSRGLEYTKTVLCYQITATRLYTYIPLYITVLLITLAILCHYWK